MNTAQSIRLFLCGDVMTARGIDQVLPHPSDPLLHEAYVADARDYVTLAERAHGRIPRPVGAEYIWGDALDELRQGQPDLRIINLETSVTVSDDHWPDKEIHYRMHPENIRCLTAAGIDCCTLANNHVLDWGYFGLTETLDTLDRAGLRHTGAGDSVALAAAPAVLDVPHRGRVLVFALAAASSGVDPEWAATRERPGVNRLADLSEATAREAAGRIQHARMPGDLVVVSIHWGGNWGYHIEPDEVRFAHRLVDEGADLVCGHSSHHVKGLEVYRDRLIIYGCGDFINDYEGISGHGTYRPDLTLMYLPSLDPGTGRLTGARLVPLRQRRFRLERGGPEEAAWLAELLNRQGKPFGTAVEVTDGAALRVRWR